MGEMPRITRDARFLAPQRGTITGKAVVLCGAALVSLGVFEPQHATATIAPAPIVVQVAKPTAQPAPLVLTPPNPVGLSAQHRSHASHASHASGATSGTATPQSATPQTNTSEPTPGKSPSTAPSSSPAGSTEAPAPTPSKSPSTAPNASPARSTEAPAPTQASVTITSSPALSDIEIDGKYAGSTRSNIKLNPGSHEITVKKDGFEPWSRTLDVTAGSELTVNADLQLAKKVPAKKSTPSKK
jgi:hypothetical protein